MNKALKKRGVKKSKKTLGKPSTIAQMKKGILNPRSGPVELKLMGRPKTKLKGSPKTKLKKAAAELKASKKAIKEGKIKI